MASNNTRNHNDSLFAIYEGCGSSPAAAILFIGPCDAAIAAVAKIRAFQRESGHDADRLYAKPIKLNCLFLEDDDGPLFFESPHIDEMPDFDDDGDEDTYWDKVREFDAMTVITSILASMPSR